MGADIRAIQGVNMSRNEGTKQPVSLPDFPSYALPNVTKYTPAGTANENTLRADSTFPSVFLCSATSCATWRKI